MTPRELLERAEVVPIDSLKPSPNPIRIHPQRNIDAIAASLKQFGQQKPVVVDSGDHVRAGYGLWQAARSLGWKEILIVRSDLVGRAVEAYEAADNRTGDLSYADLRALSSILGDVHDESPDLVIGYSAGELSLLLGRDGDGGDGDGGGLFRHSDDEAPPEAFQEVSPEQMQLDHQCPKCGYRF